MKTFNRILILAVSITFLSMASFARDAKQDKAVAAFNKAQEACAKGQYALALNYYVEAYQNGEDIMSPACIAEIYMKGQHNGKPDMQEGVRWLKIAADKNGSFSGRVQCDLATHYFMGVGVPRDLSKAFYYYSLSAKNGFVEGMYYLGLAYENGEGTSVDIPKAIEWYKKAANQGHAGAANNLSRIYGMSQYGINNVEEAVKWALFAAEKGDANAQLTVGNFYLHGYGLPEDRAKAVYWLRKAAEQGVTKAQIILAQLGY